MTIDTPRGMMIESAAKHLPDWLAVLRIFDVCGARMAKQRARMMLDDDISDEDFADICKNTHPDGEFIIFKSTIPWWRFWDRHSHGLVKHCSLRIGILMAKKYRRFESSGMVESVGGSKWLESFSHGVILDYNTHEMLAAPTGLEERALKSSV